MGVVSVEKKWYVLRVDINREDEEKEKQGKKADKVLIPREEKVLKKLKGWLKHNPDKESIYKPFIIKKVYPHTKRGKLLYTVERICFPGYVFIETEKDEDFVFGDEEFMTVISKINEAHYFLHYNDNVMDDGKHQKREYAMRHNEKNELAKSMNDCFVIDQSKGLMDGDKIKIISGAFVGREGIIKKLDKRRMTAVVELGLFGGRTVITIMLEVIEKANC
jgi:transcriptional antiterminator NusG